MSYSPYISCISKICSKCKLDKPLECFGIDKKQSLGVTCRCKECLKIARGTNEYRAKKRTYHKEHPEIRKTYKIKNKHKYLLYQAKRRAKLDNIQFNLTFDDIIIPDVCPILGTRLFLDSKDSAHIPSLDRIDNSKGYIKGNVCVISLRANRMKSDGTIDDFKKIIAYMENNEKAS